MQSYTHWHLVERDQLLWVILDKANSAVNTLDVTVLNELSAIFETLNETAYRGVVIASQKTTGFIAGADITQFGQFKDFDQATQALLHGQRVFNQIENCHLPTIALIDGFCLGGGLELALACRYRLATDHPKTKLGLPEVKLGIYPGWGGTIRLPRLIGVLPAFSLILSGRVLSAKAAAKLGLIEACVPKRQLSTAAKYYLLTKPARRHTPWQRALHTVMDYKIVRQLVAYYLRKTLQKKIQPAHYPAPFRVIDNWEQEGLQGERPYQQEATGCGQLVFSETSQNLVKVFFLQERLKGLAKGASFSPKRVHVVGAGTMGGDIAAWCALRGLIVTLQDLEPRFIAPAIKRAYALFCEKLKEPYLVQQAMDRLIPDQAGNGVSCADVIIEAVIEDVAVKQALFKRLERLAKPEAIFATNTSSILLDEIGVELQTKARLVGIHFFNPVAKMQLVEVVSGTHTSPDIAMKAMSFVRLIDRLPLPVKSAPGFLVNRILMPYLLESVVLVEQGVPITVIDKTMLNYGMPMGPLTLADTIGLDVCLAAAKQLSQHLKITIPLYLEQLVKTHKWGRKTGEGFYCYTKQGKQIKPKSIVYKGPISDLQDRLIQSMVQEAKACLQENIVSDKELLNAGMIFGTGFAPFRGGLV